MKKYLDCLKIQIDELAEIRVKLGWLLRELELEYESKSRDNKNHAPRFKHGRKNKLV